MSILFDQKYLPAARRADDAQIANLEYLTQLKGLPAPLVRWTPKYVAFKFLCDKICSLIALPIILFLSLTLLVLNPFLNPGPVFFRQDRMGMGGRRFSMWKFRTMAVGPESARAHDAPLEESRITSFAKLLRKYRVDEPAASSVGLRLVQRPVRATPLTRSASKGCIQPWRLKKRQCQTSPRMRSRSPR